MSEIPTDIMEAARLLHQTLFDHCRDTPDVRANLADIAATIMAERDRGLMQIANEMENKKVATIDPVQSAYFRGLLLIVHPDMPPHVWDGKKMTPITIGVDLADPTTEVRGSD